MQEDPGARGEVTVAWTQSAVGGCEERGDWRCVPRVEPAKPAALGEGGVRGEDGPVPG